MKMDRIRLIGSTTVELPLPRGNRSGPFALRHAEGLGPPEVSLKMARSATEQARYQGRVAALRRITLTVALKPNWSTGVHVDELREQLYSLMTPHQGALLKVEIVNDLEGVLAYAEGHITRIDPTIFSKEPLVQLAIDCDHPYLLHPTYMGYEAPFTDMGSYQLFEINNVGTAPCGFVFHIEFPSGHSGDLILKENSPTGKQIRIVNVNWGPGDRLRVDTRPGFEAIGKLSAGGNYFNIINDLSAVDSEWLQLHHGINKLTLNVASASWYPPDNFAYQPAYWGL